SLTASPSSFFSASAAEPPVIGIGVGRRSSGHAKDTRANIVETGEFVVNLVAEETASAMNVTAIEFEPDVDELAEAKLSVCPSVAVKPPRIAESPVAMECALLQLIG